MTITLLPGCGGGPSALSVPDFNPASASSKAIESYDANDDGLLTKMEVEESPELTSVFARLDTNDDGNLSRDEIVSRINTWIDSRIGITSVECRVTYKGRPLAGATVTYVPAPFLSTAIQASEGTTGRSGRAFMSIPKEKRLTADTPSGVQFGLYSVRISKLVKGKEIIPPQYNTETRLAQEVSFDDPGMQTRIVYDVKD